MEGGPLFQSPGTKVQTSNNDMLNERWHPLQIKGQYFYHIRGSNVRFQHGSYSTSEAKLLPAKHPDIMLSLSLLVYENVPSNSGVLNFAKSLVSWCQKQESLQRQAAVYQLQ